MDLETIIRQYSPPLSPLEALYKDIHQHPELSRREARTSSLIARKHKPLCLSFLSFTAWFARGYAHRSFA